MSAFLTALDSIDTVFDFRLIHDKDKSRPAVALRGSYAQHETILLAYNAAGYGVFVMINASDGAGLHASNVASVRAQFVDLDGVNSAANYAAACNWECPPHWVVSSSEGRWHLYWKSIPHDDIALFSVLQRKLITKFEGDPVIFDPTRIMRLPGFWNTKRELPHMVTVGALPAFKTAPYAKGRLEWALATVREADGGGDHTALGDPALAAPSIEWAIYALSKIDPGQCDRGEWLKLTAAFKSAAWSHVDETALRMLWDQWCARYPDNNLAENDKLWRSIKETKTGWGYLMRSAGVGGELMFGGAHSLGAVATAAASVPVAAAANVPVAAVAASVAVTASVPVAAVAASVAGGWMLTPAEQAQYFAGYVLIENMGRMLTPQGRLWDNGKFNSAMGGKVFVLDANGSKSTDEPWKAATRGQVFNVQKVDHIRFLPVEQPGAIITDELGRTGVNIYKEAVVTSMHGDPTPFLSLLQRLFATERDIRIFINYLAHCKQRPGRKVPWAPVIQSLEGGGKGVIKLIITHAIGAVYTHSPNAQELRDSGSKFNAWMRAKLLIIVDEIKVDENRDMIEVLKPMITEDRMEIQGKGLDQDMEDNVSNWLFFTNYKNAVPISKHGRRYSIFYSPLQTIDDLKAAGMDGDYFPRLYQWARGDGKAIVADFLQNYAIDAEFDPMGAAHRAPVTSSTDAALVMSRGRYAAMIVEAAESNEVGFRGGWVSSVMMTRLFKDLGMSRIGPHTIKEALAECGYHFIGRSGRLFAQEDFKQPNLYSLTPNAHVHDYEKAQGYAV